MQSNTTKDGKKGSWVYNLSNEILNNQVKAKQILTI